MPLTKIQQEMLPAGSIVQIVNTSTGAQSSGNVIMPHDDTVPQNTEGTQYMTLAITPTSATNKLLVTVVANVAQSDAGGAYVVGALFQDSTASALNASEVYINGTGQNKQLVLSHYMTSGTTSSTTFKFRAGPHLAASVYFNGNGGGRLLGGVYISSITITEIKA